MDTNVSITLCNQHKPTSEIDNQFQDSSEEEQCSSVSQYEQNLQGKEGSRCLSNNIKWLRAELFVRGFPLEEFDFDLFRLCTRFIEILIQDQRRKESETYFPCVEKKTMDRVTWFNPRNILKCHAQNSRDTFKDYMLTVFPAFELCLSIALMDVDIPKLASEIVEDSNTYSSNFQEELKSLKQILFELHPDTRSTTSDKEVDVERIHTIQKRIQFLRRAKQSDWLIEKAKFLLNTSISTSIYTYDSHIHFFDDLHKRSFDRNSSPPKFIGALHKSEKGRVDLEQESTLVQKLIPYIRKHMTFLSQILPLLAFQPERVKEFVWQTSEGESILQNILDEQINLSELQTPPEEEFEVEFSDLDYASEVSPHMNYSLSQTWDHLLDCYFYYLHPLIPQKKEIITHMSQDNLLHYNKELNLCVLHSLKEYVQS